MHCPNQSSSDPVRWALLPNTLKVPEPGAKHVLSGAKTYVFSHHCGVLKSSLTYFLNLTQAPELII